MTDLELPRKLCHDSDAGSSLLDLHLRLLDDPDDRENPEWARVQAQRMLSAKPLGFRRVKLGANSLRWLPGIATLAASVAVIHFLKPEADLSYKGRAKVFVIIEDKDGVAVWDGAIPLESGTKVNTEILSTQDSVAFTAIFDRKHHLISPEDSIAKSQLILKAGNRDHFKNAFELSPENDGEQLVTIVCDKGQFEQKSKDNMDTLTHLMKSKPTPESLSISLPFCGIEHFTLRK